MIEVVRHNDKRQDKGHDVLYAGIGDSDNVDIGHDKGQSDLYGNGVKEGADIKGEEANATIESGYSKIEQQ